MVQVGRKTLLTSGGFLTAIGILAVLIQIAGPDRFFTILAQADPFSITAIFGVTLAWLITWALALRTILSSLNVRIPRHTAFLVFAGATCANNVTPFGQAGGEPFAAYLISKTTETEYETGLASIASVDTINFIPSATLALGGISYIAAVTTLGQTLEYAFTAITLGGVAVLSIGVFTWRNRARVERALINGLVVLSNILAIFPPLSALSRADIATRVTGFRDAIARVAVNRRTLALAIGLSALGWLFQMSGLWLAFHALGTPLPLIAPLIAVPIGVMASVAPLPGGSGGVETLLVLLLLSLPNFTAAEPTVIAAVLLYRGFVYWTPILIGGSFILFIGATDFKPSVDS